MHSYTYIHACMYECMYILYVFMHAYIYTYINTNMHAHIHARIYANMEIGAPQNLVLCKGWLVEEIESKGEWWWGCTLRLEWKDTRIAAADWCKVHPCKVYICFTPVGVERHQEARACYSVNHKLRISNSSMHYILTIS